MAKLHEIILGGGCFWCLDAVYRQVKGIESSLCGYAGGTVANPIYEQVSSGNTGHVEVVQLRYEPEVISLTTILDIFWATHDPTTLNRQGNDKGPQYRSIIFYQNDEERAVIAASLTKAQKLWDDPIVTEVKPLDTFYPAEAYHQNYFVTHPEQAYCQVIINPKLQKLQHNFASLLK